MIRGSARGSPSWQSLTTYQYFHGCTYRHIQTNTNVYFRLTAKGRGGHGASHSRINTFAPTFPSPVLFKAWVHSLQDNMYSQLFIPYISACFPFFPQLSNSDDAIALIMNIEHDHTFPHANTWFWYPNFKVDRCVNTVCWKPYITHSAIYRLSLWFSDNLTSFSLTVALFL